jgi:FAD/FMN-containing dehydrogenase/Fe-S oxidoreductase
MTITSPPSNRQRITIPSKPDPLRPGGVSGREEIDVKGLFKALAREIKGEVRFDRGSLGLYATDSSNYRQVPIGVVIPRTFDDVVITHQLCSHFRAPIVNRGGGTSLSGETVNFAVVIDHSKYLNRIGETDVVHRLVTVENGAINEQVNIQTGKVGLIFGPDPSSHAYCTIGGNVGNNSCGIHSIQSQFYGPGPRTSDNVHSLEVVTYDGERFTIGVNEESQIDQIIRQGGRKSEIYQKLRDLRDRYAHLIRKHYPSVSELPRRVSGFNLDELLPERGFNVARAIVGTESTCVTVLKITLMLTPALMERMTVVVSYDEIFQAGDDISSIMEWKPIGVEGIDHRLFVEENIEKMHLSGLRQFPLSGENAWLLVQFGSDTAADVQDKADRFADWLHKDKGYSKERVVVYKSEQMGGDTDPLWEVREGGLGATAFPPSGLDHWPGWEDSAVPPVRVGSYLRDLKALYKKHSLRGAIYGHLGQGCIHSRISFDLRHADGIRNYRAFLDEASDLVVSYGGSLSGEHGDGQQRAEFLYKQYGNELVEAMREFKLIWDPQWKMNPGKVIEPYRIDENLKLGQNYSPPHPPVKFAYTKDRGDFAHATLRCVGVGKCRQPHGVDVMCPSYIVTKEEKDTTRGRARLLFEMLQGEVIRDGWKSREVFDALDLCLSCKGCTSDCPVHVDMPTLKAEFLYHYYKGFDRNRKRYMYAFGYIDKFAYIASLMPEIANFFTQTPGLSFLAKEIAGMDQHRRIPKFAPLTLQSWYKNRGGPLHPNGPKVILWPDTFNNHFHTEVGVASVEALEAAGFRVLMPTQHVCCGRPLFDYGFLDEARRYLRHVLNVLKDEIRQGTAVIGMEPSCLAVFRDELTNLFPHDEDAQRLSRNSYHWAEFFMERGLEVPRLERDALLWGHCHHKATGGVKPEQKMLEKMGLSVEEVTGGCCGLAGSWGFEKGKYKLSMEIGEIALLPAVRKAKTDTIIVANGFSCKTQIEEANLGRKALHAAQVMKMARDKGTSSYRGSYPERDIPPPPKPAPATRIARTLVVILAGMAMVNGGLWLAKKMVCRH